MSLIEFSHIVLTRLVDKAKIIIHDHESVNELGGGNHTLRMPNLYSYAACQESKALARRFHRSAAGISNQPLALSRGTDHIR